MNRESEGLFSLQMVYLMCTRSITIRRVCFLIIESVTVRLGQRVYENDVISAILFNSLDGLRVFSGPFF